MFCCHVFSVVEVFAADQLYLCCLIISSNVVDSI